MEKYSNLEKCIGICNKQYIKINYEISEDSTELRKAYLVQLKVDNGFIYLIAYIVDKYYSNLVFFCLERMRNFTISYE